MLQTRAGIDVYALRDGRFAASQNEGLFTAIKGLPHAESV
jgi:hypothetical protein